MITHNLYHSYLVHLSKNSNSKLSVKFKSFKFPFFPAYSTNLIVSVSGLVYNFNDYKPEQAEEILNKLNIQLPYSFIIGNTWYMALLDKDIIINYSKKSLSIDTLEFSHNLNSLAFKTTLKALQCKLSLESKVNLVWESKIKTNFNYLSITFPTFNPKLSQQLATFLCTYIQNFIPPYNIITFENE